MNKLTIEIELENEAFEEGQYEIARILSDLAQLAEQQSLSDKSLRDLCGNNVGFVKFE